MNISEKIKDIREAREKNKLVIFVGAGVSWNSNIPTWGDLVKEFAKQLNYDKCRACSFKDENCPREDCKQRYNFSQEEYLKIPQYFYNKDETLNKERYKAIITNTLDVEVESNEINNIIMKILPKHIITTNYDRLIEDTKVSNARLYSCVYEDKDLLIQNGSNYIIKMHGDIKNLENIVLKEDDYIHYEQNHILIQTYIKALLVDHTFLFIGYSLNDYNLKLIMGWIEYLAKENEVKDKRPNHYIIQVNNAPNDDYIEQYFEENNIRVLNTNDLLEEMVNKYNNINLSEAGRKVYTYLSYILDDNNDDLMESFIDTLYDKYKIFDEFRRISYEDLLSVYRLGNAIVRCNILCFWEEQEYNRLEEVLTAKNKKADYIENTFIKAGIYSIGLINSKKRVEFSRSNFDKVDDLFELYLQNKYLDIILMKDDISNDNVISYYDHLIIPHLGNASLKLDEIDKNVLNDNLYNLVVYKYNRLCFNKLTFQETDWKEFETILSHIPNNQRKAYGYIEKLLHKMEDKHLKQQGILNKLEKRYLNNNNNTLYSGNSLDNLFDLQTLAYDYYFFFKLNHLMLDFFTNPKECLMFYLKAILCTYSSKKNEDINVFNRSKNHLPTYIINQIDFDMFVKYTKDKELKDWVREYSIEKIKVDETVKAVEKFDNFCKSLMEFPNMYTYGHFKSFIVMLSNIQFNQEEIRTIITSLSNLVKQVISKKTKEINIIFDSVIYFCEAYKNQYFEEFRLLLSYFLDINIIRLIKEENNCPLERLIKLLNKYTDDELISNIEQIINEVEDTEEKISLIYDFSTMLIIDKKEKYSIIISENIALLDEREILLLAIDNVFKDIKVVKQRLVDIINNEHQSRKEQPGLYKYPDHLQEALNSYIILYLLEKIDDLSMLVPYKEYSSCLEFLLNPDEFDYSSIDIDDYMWLNILKQKEYRDIIIQHRDQLVIEELKLAVERNCANEEQKKIVYRYILSEDEIFS